MAVRRTAIGILACVLGAAPSLAAGEPATAEADGDARQAGRSHLHELLSRTLTFVGLERPQWLVEQSRDEIDPASRAGDAGAQLVMQPDRRDGADLLTLRYLLLSRGALRTYAGAGLNRASFLAGERAAPVMLTHRNRQHSLGAAAEVGAEVQLSHRLMLNADLRWLDLDEDAVLLSSDDGFVGADPVSVGLSVGWRFR